MLMGLKLLVCVFVSGTRLRSDLTSIFWLPYKAVDWRHFQCLWWLVWLSFASGCPLHMFLCLNCKQSILVALMRSGGPEVLSALFVAAAAILGFRVPSAKTCLLELWLVQAAHNLSCIVRLEQGP